jgi:hypothetical protein
MSRLEENLLRRFSGPQIVAASLALGAGGLAPLALYSAFGPPHGNPIGLGLLAALAVPVALVGVFVGLVKTLVQLFGRRAG